MNFEGLDLATLLAIVAGFITYFMPWSVAALRDHRRQYMIGLLNLLLGWTGIGWIVALLWAAGTKSGHEQQEEEEKAEPELASDRRVQGNAAVGPKYSKAS